MSQFDSALQNLSSPSKELVSSSSVNKGKTPEDEQSVNTWIQKIADGQVKDVKELNDQLVPKTFIATNYLSAADVALYAALHPIVSSKLANSEENIYAHPAIVRYFDHVQHAQPVRSSADALSPPAFPILDLKIDQAPKVERKPIDPSANKKKAAKDKSKPAEDSSVVDKAVSAVKDAKDKVVAAAGAVVGTSSDAKQPAAKKEKKEKQPKEKAATPAKNEDAGEPKPSMIDLRVGHIVDIKKHPDADGLYVEQIDIGEETGPRTVVSGLVNYIPIEQMRDKYLVAVCNLKPANMRGVKSFAMVLCATSKDGKDAGIELVQPPKGSKPGDKVYFEGSDFESATPLSQLNPKKKIFEAIQPGFTTLDSHEAAWVDPATKSVHRIRTAKGVCIAPTFVGASLS